MHPLIENALAEGRHLLEPEALSLLEAYGITVPRHRVIHTEEEAVEAVESLGCPVVMKVVSPDILHKTEASGVILNLRDEQEVRNGFSRLNRLDGLGKRIEGIIVYPFQRHDVEVFAGMLRDSQFGPVVTFGLGGIWIELFQDVAYGIAPLSLVEAEAMLRCTHCYPILAGTRGTNPADIQALCELLVSLSRMVLREEIIQEVDLNPIFPLEEGCFIADARIILRRKV